MNNNYVKLLKDDLTIEEWNQWLTETPEKDQPYKLRWYINYHIKNNEQDKIKFPKHLKMAENINFFKGWLDYKDYMLYYATDYEGVYDEDDLSTPEQLNEFGFNERQQEFILCWEEEPFYYDQNLDEFYEYIMNETLPVYLLISLYYTPYSNN